MAVATAFVTVLGVFMGGANAYAQSARGVATENGECIVASSSDIVCKASTDNALVRGLRNPDEVLSGRIPAELPRAVPIVRGRVVGGSIGNSGDSWVVAVDVADGTAFATIEAQLRGAGFTATDIHRGGDDGFLGVFAKTNYCVAVLVWKPENEGYTATYIVTITNRVAPFETQRNNPSPR